MTEEIRREIDRRRASGQLSPQAGENLIRWLTDPEYAAFQEDILALIREGSPDEFEDSFRTRIEFGTGGIRGGMGPGPNRINTRTIGEAAQGLAQYVRRAGGEVGERRGVVIACDTRINSDVFARETACILAGNGIQARLFDGFRATPELSFAVRALGAVAGVVISASHNPPTDNGFKAYWSDGAQVVPPHDRNIITEAQNVVAIRRLSYEEGVKNGLIQTVDSDIDARYLDILSDLTLTDARDIRIVYTPLHGVGMTSVAAGLKRLGYRDVHIVEEQATLDGRFPTVERGVANPEDPKALKLALRKAQEVGADIVLASDPDADRVGCALPHPEKGWQAPPEDLALNGNQIGVILCHYILEQKKRTGRLPARGLVCKTAVTTDLTTLIARYYGMETVENLLVGFKYIGAVIERMPEDMVFVFGTEESHGYLADSRFRDKEAATGILLAECAAMLRLEGRTLRDYLDDIYRKYGYFREIQKSVSREGASGNREIAAIMKGLRATPPDQIGGHRVVEMIDRQTGEALNLQTGDRRAVEGDRGNILLFTFSEAGHTRVTARPSGTEPKIKYYVSASSVDQPDRASTDLTGVRAGIDRMAGEIIDGILAVSNNILA